MNILTKHPMIVEFFENWRKAYNGISGSTVTKLIQKPLSTPFDTTKHDLNIPHRSTISLEFGKKRGVHLPKTIPVPKVTAPRKKNDNIAVRLQFSTNEARALASYYQITGPLQSITNELGARIKQEILKKAKVKE
jgi:hypothetical protein